MKDVKKIFNAFAGQEIPGANDSQLPVASNPVLQAIYNLAAKNGLESVRILYPRARVTKDFRMNRLNVSVAKIGEDRYQISGFSLG